MLKKLLCALLALMLTAGCALAQTEVSGLTWESELPVEYADQFTVDFYEGGYALIQIVDGGAFLLVPEGMDAPDGLSADVCVLKKPIDRMYLAATSAMALIDAVEAGSIDGEIVLVLANASKAFALERARRHGIPAEFISKKQAGSDEAFNDVILQRLRAVNADLVVLAGYLPIVGRQIVRAFEHRIINIHPALIPAFCGPGMYGHHVHEAVLAYGAKISGATTHFVDEQVDHGGVIMQKSVPVLEGDTPETLAARVLTVEHEILPESVRLFCAEKLGVDGRQVHVL